MFLTQGLVVSTGFATVAYLTRALGPEGYGQYAIVLTILNWIDLGIGALFSRVTVKMVAESEDWRSVATKVMNSALLVSGTVMLVLWASADRIASALHAPECGWYIRLAAIDIPISTLASTHLQILVGQGRFRLRALVGMTRWIARLLLIVLLVVSGLSVAGALAGCVGASVTELLAVRLYCRPPLFHRGVKLRYSLWSYGLPLLFATLSLRLLDGLDLLMLRMLGGTAEQTGLYSVALTLALLPAMIAPAVSPIVLSSVSRSLHLGQIGEAKSQSRHVLRAVLLLLPVAALIAGMAPEITRLSFGPSFQAAGPLLAVVIFAGMGRLLVHVTEAILTAAGKPGRTTYAIVPVLPVALAGYRLLIPWLGPQGAAWVTVSANGLAALACLLLIYGLLRVVPPPATLVRCIVMSSLIFLLAPLWPVSGLLVLVKGAVFILLIAVAFLLLGELDPHERAWLWSLLHLRGQGRCARGQTSGTYIASPASTDRV
jgi:O-antigen/teichoic acid export membrane protein